jgi:hypothetical protein
MQVYKDALSFASSAKVHSRGGISEKIDTLSTFPPRMSSYYISSPSI